MPKPTLAVALRYDKPRAPRVVAVGRGHIGQKIIDTAREHGVPLRQDPVLAEVLATIELDDEIPEALYRAVAEVIGFVLRTSAKQAEIGPTPAISRNGIRAVKRPQGE